MGKRVYALVYQCGIANVFRFTPNRASANRVRQGSFGECEAFVAGLLEAGCVVELRHCDQAGDITMSPWPTGQGDLFAEGKRPPIRCRLP